MKMMKKVFSLLVSLLLFVTCMIPSTATMLNVAAATESATGMRFTATDNFEMDTLLTQTPLSYEATFKITSEEASTGEGYIFSNYSSPQNGAIFNLRVTNTGAPLLYLRQNGGTYNYYIRFANVNVATGAKVHLAVTTDRESFYCYVNGQLKQTVARDTTNTASVDPSYGVKVKVRLGNQTNDNSKYFKGELYSLALFNDTRTATEVAADATSLSYTTSGIMAAYDFTGLTTGQATIQDLSGNGNHFSDSSKFWTWSTTPQYDPDDYAFSFMLVGDTQCVSKRSMIDTKNGVVSKGNNYMDMIYDYIVDNVETKKVKHVFGLGDITEYNSKNEWQEAARVISKMDGVVPYSLIRGNHDLATNWWANSQLKNNASYANDEPYFIYDYVGGGEGSPKNGTVDTALCDKYFATFFNSQSAYTQQYAYSYNNSVNNTIHFFTGSDRLEYMVVALDYGPTDDMLNWASNIIKQYPNHNVIVTTHGYMWADGTYLDKNDGGMAPTAGANGASANCGDEMWTEFVSQHANIKMLFCGHVDNDMIVYRQDKGVNGNVVTQMLCDPQGIDVKNVNQPLVVANGDTPANRLVGMVATYYVSADGKTIDVEWYSPIQKAYYLQKGQFTFTTEATEMSKVTASVKGGNGTVSPTSMNLSNIPVLITFTPDEGYTVKKVTLNGVDVTDQVVKNKLTVTEKTGYHVVEVEYCELEKYPLTIVNEETKGTIDGLTASNYIAGKQLTFTITPNENYIVSAVKFNGHTLEAVNGVYTATILETDNILEVVYEAAPPVDSSGVSSEDSAADSGNDSTTNAAAFGCFGAVSWSSMLGVLALCGAALIQNSKSKNK